MFVTLALTCSAGCASMTAMRRNYYLDHARTAYTASDYRTAATDYRRYLRDVPGDAEAWYRLGNANAQLGRLRDAEAAYDRALKLDPALARAQHNLGLVHMQLAWKNLLAARRHLPREDHAAAETMRYLACLMETFMGYPEPSLCQGKASELKGDSDD